MVDENRPLCSEPLCSEPIVSDIAIYQQLPTRTGLRQFAGGLVFVVSDPLDSGFLRAQDFRFWLRAGTADDFLHHLASHHKCSDAVRHAGIKRCHECHLFHNTGSASEIVKKNCKKTDGIRRCTLMDSEKYIGLDKKHFGIIRDQALQFTNGYSLLRSFGLDEYR